MNLSKPPRSFRKNPVSGPTSFVRSFLWVSLEHFRQAWAIVCVFSIYCFYNYIVEGSRIVLITACGKKKEDERTIAGLLYKSSRIRYLYKKAKKLKIPFFILSAKYGLVYSEEIIEPYDEVMTEEKCEKLKNQIISVLKKYDLIIYYKGGSGRIYLNCIEQATKRLNKTLIVFGFKQIGDINKLEDIIRKYQVNKHLKP